MSARTYAVALLALAAIFVLAAGAPATAELVPLTGAIWTTTGTGEKVDANLYDQKCPPDPDPCVTPPLVPFLNGGPNFAAPTQWVPDGHYYFQVTDPSGKTLLSNDDIESRRFRVYTDGLGVKHTEYPVPLHPSPDPFHITCTDSSSGNITIALCPYDDTPNNGGEYKLWITPVEAYWANDEQFVGRYTKTDNFKVKSRASVWGTKLDGTQGLEGVCIVLYEVQKVRGQETLVEIARTCTGPTGVFSFTDLDTGKYAVDEDLSCTDCGFDHSGCDRISPEGPIYFTITKADLGSKGKDPQPGQAIEIGTFVNDCGPPPVAALQGVKFLDADGDGCLGAGETPLVGWQICLEMKNGNGSWIQAVDIDGLPVPCQTTAADGSFNFGNLPVPMTYRITETPVAGWLQTGPNLTATEIEDPCGDITTDPPDADVTPIAVNGTWVVNFGETADVLTIVDNLNFGNKLATICVEKRDACTGAPLDGFEFTLYQSDCTTPVTQDALGNAISPIVTGSGDDCWENLLAGAYCVVETPEPGWIPVGLDEQPVALAAGATATVTFENWAPSLGLTPGYWKNWRNHYTSSQFCDLLVGTIADVGDCSANIAAADAIYAHYDASPGDELTILKAFLLADQLTVNLTTLYPTYPNPSGGSLVLGGSILYYGSPIVLGSVIANALDCLSNGCSREEILTIKNHLAAFAEANYTDPPCS